MNKEKQPEHYFRNDCHLPTLVIQIMQSLSPLTYNRLNLYAPVNIGTWIVRISGEVNFPYGSVRSLLLLLFSYCSCYPVSGHKNVTL